MTSAEGNGACAPVRRYITAAQLAANRRNARKGGVKTQAGKDISRLNARKSGIFAVVLTPADRQELALARGALRADYRPVGRRENDIVDQIALLSLRLQRCHRLETERYVALGVTGASPAAVIDFFETSMRVHRYDASLWKSLLRLVRELDHLRRCRGGNSCRPVEGELKKRTQVDTTGLAPVSCGAKGIRGAASFPATDAATRSVYRGRPPCRRGFGPGRLLV